MSVVGRRHPVFKGSLGLGHHATQAEDEAGANAQDGSEPCSRALRITSAMKGVLDSV
jgi:hypothetical protein